MADKFLIDCVGIIRKQGKSVAVEIYEEYKDGLLGLDQFSHVIMCFWFHKHDSPEQRNILRVHPRGNKANPLTGVFATRSPQRPNLFGISTCKILAIDGNIIYIDQTDAFNGSPVIDLKPYIATMDSIPNATAPEWVQR
ncbi:MAG: tRNA (N6-threonylcarbamoyladenosine(37)-N6)-methyltransferase TrmO [Deltaproteobacteria bacterium]|nr:tRNA (N6-threonylcarbamoyladenosine(37)-N6)-methyltransferase TrmO [Deltaproteobacteria bacterium]